MEHIRKQLGQQILGGNAFKKIEEILEEVPFGQLGKQFEGLPYTFWQQFEHMRITQKDILDFSIGKDYQELAWPKDYWIKEAGPKDPAEWEKSKAMFFKDREAILYLIHNRESELSEPLEHGDGQTLFREALLVLEHNAYHTGQMMIIFRLINGNQNKNNT